MTNTKNISLLHNHLILLSSRVLHIECWTTKGRRVKNSILNYPHYVQCWTTKDLCQNELLHNYQVLEYYILSVGPPTKGRRGHFEYSSEASVCLGALSSQVWLREVIVIISNMQWAIFNHNSGKHRQVTNELRVKWRGQSSCTFHNFRHYFFLSFLCTFYNLFNEFPWRLFLALLESWCSSKLPPLNLLSINCPN